MSVDRHADGRFRYRATAYYNDGTSCRISGTAPKKENTRAAAQRCEADHIARIASQPPLPFGQPKARNGTNHTGPLTVDPTPATAATAPTATPIEPPKPAVPTLTAFAPVYLASSRLDNALSSVESKEDALSLHILPRLGDLRLDQIDYAVIADFKVTLSETRNRKVKREVKMLKAKTINNVLTVLGHVLQIARKRGLIGSVPEITRVKTPLPKWVFLTPGSPTG